jgi:hypothetical protein
MPKDSIVFKAKSQKLTAFSRTRDARRLSRSIFLYNPHTIPIGQSSKKHKARDENRQKGEQAAVEIAFHVFSIPQTLCKMERSGVFWKIKSL